MEYVTLTNGKKLPIVGYGTYKITEDEVCECVLEALGRGYRRIDTATFYANEAGIGEAYENSGLKRSEIYLATKLWTNVTSEKAAKATVERSLRALRTDYLDMLLIHWPTAANAEVWRAMEDMYFEGILKGIGVSNFKEHHIDELNAVSRISPMWNQIELHPYFRQQALRDYCKGKGIVVEAWSPLMRGSVLDEPVLKEIAAKYGKSVAAVILRADVEEGIAVIPKTVSPERMSENIDIFDFSLTADELQAIAALDRGARQYRDPDNHGF